MEPRVNCVVATQQHYRSDSANLPCDLLLAALPPKIICQASNYTAAPAIPYLTMNTLENMHADAFGGSANPRQTTSTRLHTPACGLPKAFLTSACSGSRQTIQADTDAYGMPQP